MTRSFFFSRLKYRISKITFMNEKLVLSEEYKLMVFENRVLRSIYEGWNFNSGNYLFTTDTK